MQKKSQSSYSLLLSSLVFIAACGQLEVDEVREANKPSKADSSVPLAVPKDVKDDQPPASVNGKPPEASNDKPPVSSNDKPPAKPVSDPPATSNDLPPVVSPVDIGGCQEDPSLCEPPSASLPPEGKKAFDFQMGFVTACALKANGTLACWGRNGSGQIGDGTTTDREVPTAVSGIANVTMLDVGGYSACAVTNDGSLYCWGDNAYGQLGVEDTQKRLKPTLVKSLKGGIVQLALGYKHSCALVTGGRVMCWGLNETGQLGDGTLVSKNKPTYVKDLNNVVQIQAGTYHSCALKNTGSVFCWGDNRKGALGLGTKENKSVPTQIPSLSDVIHIAGSGNGTGCAVRKSGDVHCWGVNNRGENGTGKVGGNTYRPNPPVVGLSGAMRVFGGQHYLCALTREKSVYCWGDNRNGQMGRGSSAPENQPTAQKIPDLSNVTELETGGYRVCGTQQDGIPLCWGSGSGNTPKRFPGL